MARSHTLSGQTIAISLLSLVGVGVALASSLVVAYFYGTSQHRDAYLQAQVIPSYATSVMSGNVSMLFTPVFIECYTNDTKQAWRVASSVLSVTVVVSAILVVTGVLFSQDLATWIAPGQTAAQHHLTSKLLRVLMPSVLFGGTGSLLASLHYAEHRFVLPTVAPIVAAVVALVVNLVLEPLWGIFSLAAGFTFGSLISALMLAPGILAGGNLKFSLDLRDAGLRRLFRASLPLVMAGILYRFNTGFERMIGSSLPTGSISLVAYATQVVFVLSTVTSSGVTTTVFPLLARSWAERDMVSVRRYFAIAQRSILLVALPTVAFVVLFGSVIVSILFERGAFDRAATAGVTRCLTVLMVGFLATSYGQVVVRCFYVAQRTTFLAVYSVVETAAYIGLAFFLSRRMSYTGLAAASSLRDTIGVLVYLVFAIRMLNGVNGREMFFDVVKATSCTLVLIVSLLPLRWLLTAHLPPLAIISAAVVLGAFVYGFMTMRVFRIPEALRLFEATIGRVPVVRRWGTALWH